MKTEKELKKSVFFLPKPYANPELLWVKLITHDFNSTFINHLWLFKSLENKDLSYEQFLNFLPQLKEEAKKNLQIIQDSGDWLKFHDFDFSQSKNEFFFSDIFLRLQKEFSVLLAKKEIDLRKQEEDVILETFPELFFFLIKKILHNAIKFSYRKSEILLKIDSTEDFQIVTVEDDGIGMSSSTCKALSSSDPVIFKGTENEVGIGLSLQIVNFFVYSLKGKLKIETALNSGTKVSIFLPKN